GDSALIRLVAEDERQLHDLRLRKVRPEPGEAEVGHLAVLAGDAFGELERRLLPRREAGVVRVSGEGGQRLDGDSGLHADGALDVHSVDAAAQRGDVDLKEG